MTIRIAWDLELHNDGPSEGNPHPPCYGIIQLGWTIFSTKTGIIEVGGDYIKTGLPLSPYIQNLTGIKEKDITEKGVSIHEAYLNMQKKWEFWVKVGKETRENAISQPINWGDDVTELKQELVDKQFENLSDKELKPNQEIIYFKEFTNEISESLTQDARVRNNYNWVFGRTFLNLKTVYQMIRMAQNKPYKGGLKKSLQALGLQFQPYKEQVSDNNYKMRGAHSAFADSLNTAYMYLELQKYIKDSI